MLSKVILYTSGIVVCRSEDGTQSPRYQGLFTEIADNIKKDINLNAVKFYYQKPGEMMREVSKDEWFKLGNNIGPVSLRESPLPPDLEFRIRRMQREEKTSND